MINGNGNIVLLKQCSMKSWVAISMWSDSPPMCSSSYKPASGPLVALRRLVTRHLWPIWINWNTQVYFILRPKHKNTSSATSIVYGHLTPNLFSILYRRKHGFERFKYQTVPWKHQDIMWNMNCRDFPEADLWQFDELLMLFMDLNMIHAM